MRWIRTKFQDDRAGGPRRSAKTSAGTAGLVVPIFAGLPRRGVMNGRGCYAEASDAELASWSADGDRSAFDEIVVRHGPFALRVAARLVSDRSTADDIVQEAMVRAWSQIGRFDAQRARLTTWLYRIVVNLCIDSRRRMQPGPMPEGFDPVDSADSADEAIALAERRAAVLDALEGLPVRQRAAITLVYNEGMPGAEAARVLGLSAKAVERLLARARIYLRGRLQRKHDWKGDRDVDA